MWVFDNVRIFLIIFEFWYCEGNMINCLKFERFCIRCELYFEWLWNSGCIYDFFKLG